MPQGPRLAAAQKLGILLVAHTKRVDGRGSSPTCRAIDRAPAHSPVQVVEHIVCNLIAESHPIVDGQREVGAHIDAVPCTQNESKIWACPVLHKSMLYYMLV